MECCCIRFQEEAILNSGSPIREIILSCCKLIPHLFNAENFPTAVFLKDPFPESGAEIESVMQVLGTDENICIKKIWHQVRIPRVSPSSWKVDIFLIPSRRDISLNEECPSRVALTTARANLLPTLAVAVR